MLSLPMRAGTLNLFQRVSEFKEHRRYSCQWADFVRQLPLYPHQPHGASISSLGLTAGSRGCVLQVDRSGDPGEVVLLA